MGKDTFIKIRISSGEKDLLRSNALEEGVSLSTYIRSKILNVDTKDRSKNEVVDTKRDNVDTKGKGKNEVLDTRKKKGRGYKGLEYQEGDNFRTYFK
jgi:hypothetical protein